MFKIHVDEDGQMTLPAQARAWLGLKPGQDLMIDLTDPGKIHLVKHSSGAGILARYFKPEQQPESTQLRRAHISEYLEESNAPESTYRHSRIS